MNEWLIHCAYWDYLKYDFWHGWCICLFAYELKIYIENLVYVTICNKIIAKTNQ